MIKPEKEKCKNEYTNRKNIIALPDMRILLPRFKFLS